VSGSRTLCLGEALVDLVCERPVDDFVAADAFVPQFGGATANVAVSAARHGAAVGLAGAVGADPWGRWLRERLSAEGVDLRWLRVLDGVPTPIACVVVSPQGEPRYAIYGEALAPAMEALSGDIAQAVAAFDALFFASNTLAGAVERDVTCRAREHAVALGRPVIIDANLRLERWPDVQHAAAAVLRCVPGALLVRTNQQEAEILTGRADPAEAARALLDAGARAVVVTLGAEGALLAGEHERRVPGVPCQVRSTVGAGDALTGVLLAALTRSGYDPASLADALPDAVAEGARATERWGAVEPQPPLPVGDPG
jgi:fructokinase